MLRAARDPSLAERPLLEVVDVLDGDQVHYYAPYERVHRHNLAAVGRDR